jgi:putative Mn2+ efflux pump MntP
MKTSLTILFSLLYLAVGFVSVYHSISFFSISNSEWLAVILALAFEIGQAAVLFSLLTSKSNKTMPWILMGVLTAVQVLGNVYSSYHYSVLNSPDEIKYFTDSVLFFIQDPNPQVNQVMISYITGAILPIVALCMTSMIVNVSGAEEQKEKNDEESKIFF